MNTTKKLRREPPSKSENIKLTFACPASLKAELNRNTALHTQARGAWVNVTTLIPHMLESFMAGDRGLKKGNASKSVPPKPS